MFFGGFFGSQSFKTAILQYYYFVKRLLFFISGSACRAKDLHMHGVVNGKGSCV